MGLNIDKAYVGSSEVDKIYLGTELVYRSQKGIPIEDAPNGVYILRTDNLLYTQEDWDTSWNEESVGVAVVSSNCKFVINKEAITNMKFESDGEATMINDIVTTTDESVAKNDYSGLENTNKIISQLGGNNVPTANYCATYSFLNGKKGYLGSLGEWVEAYNHKTDVDTCMSLINGEKIHSTSGLWTSTQRDIDFMWNIEWGNGEIGHYAKIFYCYLRPFAPLT